MARNPDNAGGSGKVELSVHVQLQEVDDRQAAGHGFVDQMDHLRLHVRPAQRRIALALHGAGPFQLGAGEHGLGGKYDRFG